MLKSPALRSMFKTQVRNARMGAEQIEAVAIHLAQLMHDYHGDLNGHGWEVCISHDAGTEIILIKQARKGMGVTVDNCVDNGENRR